MKKRKTKLWKKLLVGFMSFTMFLGNLSTLSLEAYAATDEVLYDDEAEEPEDFEPAAPVVESLQEAPADEYDEEPEEEPEEVTYYTVTFFDVDGSLLGSSQFAEGEALVLPETGDGAYWLDDTGVEYYAGDEVYDDLSLFVTVDDTDYTDDTDDADDYEDEELPEDQLIVRAVLVDTDGAQLDSYRVTEDMYLDPDSSNDAPVIDGYEFAYARIDASEITEVLVDETEDGVLVYTVDGVALEADADIVLVYESTAFNYSITAEAVDDADELIAGYEAFALPEFDKTLDLTEAPVEIEGYEYVEAAIGGETVTSVTVDGSDGYYETADGIVDIDRDVLVTLFYEELPVAATVDATIVDEFGDEIAEEYTGIELPKFDADGILVLDDTELPPVKDVKVRTGLFRTIKYTYVKATVNNKLISALKAEDGADGTYYYYTTDGETWTNIKEDTTVIFEYTDGKKTTYVYEDAYVRVTATLQHANAIPDDAYFAVTPLNEAAGYDVDTYIDALNAKADTPEGSDDFEYSRNNTLLYDIAFYTDETMTEEIEPADGMVKTEIEFLRGQLTDDLDASEKSELLVNHMSLSDSVLEDAGTTANANVTISSINVETIPADVSVANESIAFTTDGYCVFAITDGNAYPRIVIEYYEADGVTPDKAPVLPRQFLFIRGKQGDALNQHVMIPLDGSGAGELKDGVLTIGGNDFQSASLRRFSDGNYDIEFWESEYLDEAAEVNVDTNNGNFNKLDPESDLIGMYTFELPADGTSINGEYVIKAVKVGVTNGAASIKDILGNAVYFGVTANEYNQTGDTQTNFATKDFSGGKGPVGGDLSNNPGEIYAGAITGDGLQIRSNLAASDVYIGREEDKTKIEDDSKKANIVVLDQETIGNKVNSLIGGVSVPTADNMLVLPRTDGNKYFLDTTAFADNTTIHIDLDHATGSGANSFYDIMSSNTGGVYINKRAGQTIIFHSTDNDASVCKFYFNNTGNGKATADYKESDTPTSNGDGKNTAELAPLAQTLIYDFRSANDLHLTGAVTGTFIAPSAHILWDGGACCGWAVCNLAEGKSEWHNIYQDMPKSKVEDDHCELELTITKRLIDDVTKQDVDPELWPDEGFTFRVSKYLCDADGDINATELGVLNKPELIPDLTGMENGTMTVNIKRDQAGKKVTVGTAGFDGAAVWADTRCHNWIVNGQVDHRYLVFMYKVEELPCSDENIITDPETHYVKFFVNCRQIVNGNDIKYYVWVEGPNVAETVDQVNACRQQDLVMTNRLVRPTELEVTKVWADIEDNAHTNDQVLVQLTRKEGDTYVDVEGETLTLPENNSWSGKFENLPARDDAGNVIEYSVRESKVNDAEVTAEDGINTVKIGTRSYTVSVSRDDDGRYVITNTPTQKGKLWIRKRASLGTTNYNILINKIEFEIWDAETDEYVGTATHKGTNQWDFYYDDLDYGREYYLVEKNYDLDGKTLAATYTYPLSDDFGEEALYYTIQNGSFVLDDAAQASQKAGETDPFMFTEGKDCVYVFNSYAYQGTLRIHKMVVNNFGSDEVRDADSSFLNNVWFRLTNQSDGSYIVFKGFTGRAKEATGTANGHNADGSSNGQTYLVEYNEDAQWTIYDMPAGTYLVEEVGDGHTFTYDEATNTSTDNYDSEYRRITHYDVTVDQEYTTTTKSKLADNARNQRSIDNGQNESPMTAIVGDPTIGNTTHTQTVQVSNFYSNPLAPICVSKSYTGWDDETDSDRTFEFTLTAGSNTARDSAGGAVATPVPAVTTVTATKDDPIPAFGNILYDHEGTYYYTIEEVKPAGGIAVTRPDGTSGYLYDGVIYDTRVINVTVVVKQIQASFTKKYSNTDPYQETFYYLGADVTYTVAGANGEETTVAAAELRLEEEDRVDTTSRLDNFVINWTQNDSSMFNNTTEELVSVDGHKIWEDDGDRDGSRPDSITVYLLSGSGNNKTRVAGVEPATVTRAENGDWTYTFSDLPKYDSDGVEIEYSVEEYPVPAGYTATVDGYNIINTHTPVTTHIDGEKTWVDNDNRAGRRPAAIEITLYKSVNGSEPEAVETKTVTAADGWAWSFTGLHVYENGYTINYSIGEKEVPNYTTEIDGYDVINTYIPELVNVSGTKDWADDSNRDGVRPESVIIYLHANGTTVDTLVLTGDDSDSWDWSFEDLPKYEGGSLINYTVTEKVIPDYSTTITDVNPDANGNKSGITITNTHTPGRTNISGHKIWDDANDQDGIRPTMLEVTLYKKVGNNEKEEVGSQTVTAADNWAWSWNNLLAKEGGQTITYSVDEKIVPAGYTKKVDGNEITNTHKPATVSIDGYKTWDDANDQDGIRPDSVTIELYADGVKTDTTAVATAATDWKWSFTGLPKYAEGEHGRAIEYSVKEKKAEAYSVTPEEGYTVSEGHNTGLEFVNKHVPALTNISGVKTWDDNDDQDGVRPKSITIRLYANGSPVPGKVITVRPDANGDWKWSFTDLPKKSGGVNIVYTVTEDAVSNYTTDEITYDTNATTHWREAHVTNHHTPVTISIPVTKTWADFDNRDGIRPTEIRVNLLADGAQYRTATVTPDADGNWSYLFEDLPKYSTHGTEIIYTITEDEVPGYGTDISGSALNGYKITNTHTPETIDIDGYKDWDDVDDQDGIRPDSVTISLYADGEEIRTVSANAPDWRWQFTDLPRYAEGKQGKAIVYSVQEKLVASGYTVTVPESGSYAVTTEAGALLAHNQLQFKNQHTPEQISIPVRKVWDDAENQDGKQPDGVTVKLLADGDVIDTVILNDENDWEHVFTNLDKCKDGEEIVYTITEEEVPEYSTKYKIEDGVTVITNSYTPGKTSINGKKIWDDNEDQDRIRPTSITVKLYADGVYKKSANASAASDWMWQFDNLPLRAGGKDIVYTVKEDPVPAGYTSTIELVDGVYVITNTHKPETVNISGKKKWDDAGNQDGIRPQSIVIRLTPDVAGVGSQTALAEYPDYEWSFTNLPKKKDGVVINYTVSEDVVPAGYTHDPEKDITTGGHVSGSDDITGIVITNHHTPETVEVCGTKVWDDDDDRDGIRLPNVTIRLLADGTAVTGKEAVVSKDTNWSFSFKDLPKYKTVSGQTTEIEYTVEEVAPAVDSGYELESIVLDQDPVKPGVISYTVTNRHKPETISLSGIKDWDDNDDQDGIRPESVTIILYKKVGNEQKKVDEVTTDKEHSWAWSFNDLPKYSDHGKPIDYDVEEKLAVGSKYELDPDKSNEGEADSHGNVTGITFTNKYTPETVDINGTKVWDDADNQDNVRPAYIVLNLYRNGKETSIATKTISPTEEEWKAGTWEWSFTGLPKYENHRQLITYHVEETPIYDESGVKLYETSYSADGLTITNTHTPALTELKGIKVWEDDGNRDGVRPADVTIRLLADGDETGETRVVKAEDDWKFEFTGLPKFSNGKEIVYSVSEDPVNDYSTEIEIDRSGVSPYCTVTNTHTPGKVKVFGEKQWDDDDDRDGLRPETITVRLYADGTEIDYTEATEADGWAWKFDNLPQKNNGKDIVYTVTEDEIPGYKTEIKPVENNPYAWTIINKHVPELIDIPVIKIWEDDGNRDGVRPEKITVHLYADGEQVDCQDLTKDNGWKYTFTDLLKYTDHRTEITYTITEDVIEGHDGRQYKAEIEKAEIEGVMGYKITNTYIPETVTIDGEKTWVDADDQDGARPGEIKINLLADGKQIDSKTVTAENNWAWSWTDLPKYNEGTLIKYTITETEVEGYDTKISGYDVINTHIPETVNISGHKIWHDEDNNDNSRPGAIRITLYRSVNGSEPVVVKDAEDNDLTETAEGPDWSWNFTNLPKYEDGKLIIYSLKEDPVEGYETAIGTYKEIEGQPGYYEIDVTNTHETEYVGLKVVKSWFGTAPEKGSVLIRVTGKAGGTVVVGAEPQVLEYEITADDNWTFEITKAQKVLKKYWHGEEIQYYVSEIVPEGAKYVQVDASGAIFTGDAIKAYKSADGYAATIYNQPLRDITVKKQWENDPGYFGGTDFIEISLLAGTEVIKNAQIRKADGWTYTFTDLPVFDANGEKINYTVVENTRLPEYNKGGDPEIDYSQFEENGTIIIKNVLDPLTLSVNKVWLGDPVGTLHEDITVDILSSVPTEATAATVFDRIKKVLGIDSDKWYRYTTVTLGESNNWTATVDNLPRYALSGNEIVKVSYAVEEPDVPAGYTSVTNVDGDIATVINTGLTSIAGFKTWDDGNNVVGYRPGSAEFAALIGLYQDGEQIMTGSDTEHFRWLDTSGDSWSFEFYDLPADHTYTIGEIARVLGYGEPTIDGYTIRNPLEFTEISVTKIWDDQDNAFATRPSSIAFRLLANGAQANITGVTPIVTLDNVNGASYTWRNLPVCDRNGNKIAYNVEEVSVPAGYTMSVSRNGNAFTITNTFRPVETQLTVNKVWDDNNDAAKVRPVSIQVALVRNGVDIDYVTLSAANGWSHTWSGLPTILADGSGTRAVYTVREVTQILGYTVAVTGGGEVYTITNYYRVPDNPPTPPTPPEEPGDNPPPTQPPYTIPDEPTPLAGISDVLGARRAPNGSVLGARRSPQTGDASNAVAFAAAMASAGAMMGAWFAMRKRKKG